MKTFFFKEQWPNQIKNRDKITRVYEIKIRIYSVQPSYYFLKLITLINMYLQNIYRLKKQFTMNHTKLESFLKRVNNTLMIWHKTISKIDVPIFQIVKSH